MTKKAGWNCAGEACKRTANDGPLYRTGPKGEPGRFMCLPCARRQKRRRAEAAEVLGQWVYTA